MAGMQTKQLTYVVRLWREGNTDPWRASAQSAATGERIYFAAAAEVCDFLLAAMGLNVSTSALNDEADRYEGDDPRM